MFIHMNLDLDFITKSHQNKNDKRRKQNSVTGHEITSVYFHY